MRVPTSPTPHTHFLSGAPYFTSHQPLPYPVAHRARKLSVTSPGSHILGALIGSALCVGAEAASKAACTYSVNEDWILSKLSQSTPAPGPSTAPSTLRGGPFRGGQHPAHTQAFVAWLCCRPHSFAGSGRPPLSLSLSSPTG
jgi:hypothetical protein